MNYKKTNKKEEEDKDDKENEDEEEEETTKKKYLLGLSPWKPRIKTHQGNRESINISLINICIYMPGSYSE